MATNGFFSEQKKTDRRLHVISLTIYMLLNHTQRMCEHNHNVCFGLLPIVIYSQQITSFAKLLSKIHEVKTHHNNKDSNNNNTTR